MKFYTRSTYSEIPRESSPPGDEIEDTYILQKDKNGNDYLAVSGKRNNRKIIEEACSGLSVRHIMERFMSGDTSVIGNLTEADFADVTIMPQSFMDAQNQLRRATEIFESFKVEVRREYGNSVQTFLNACADGSFFKKHGLETGVIKAKPQVTSDTDKIIAAINNVKKVGDSNA